jgi:glutaconate CoA-transferase subunit B
MGLSGGGPTAIVTTMAVLRFPEEGGEAYLASVHPGHTVDEVLAETGWALAVAPDVSVTPEPSPQELAEIRRLDPQGFWTGRR